MGFKLKFSDLRGGMQGDLMQGLHFLAQKEFDNIRESNNLRRMINQIKKIMADSQDEQTAILKGIADKFGKKDEAGVLVPRMEEGKEIPNSYLIKEDCVEGYKKAIGELEAIETTSIESYKIKLSSLENFKLPPMVLVMIDPVIEDDLDSEGSANTPDPAQNVLPLGKK